MAQRFRRLYPPSVVRTLLDGLVDLVLAPVCLGCEGLIRAGDSARLVCRQCRTRIKALPAPFCARCGAPRLATGRTAAATCPECDEWPAVIRHARSACLLHPPADTIVHQLKYRGWYALAGPMAERMASIHLPAEPGHAPRYCIPVPTTASRLRERGYNQAEVLAAGYTRHMGLELAGWLRRTGARGSQTTLQPMERAANVAGAFALTDSAGEHAAGAHVVLVDDVLTTGATTVECARTLEAAGVCCVSIMTFARALDARRLLHT